MNNLITYVGKIVFEPKNITKKHQAQSSWKRVAFIDFGNTDLCAYYSWFLFKRFGLVLNKPLRNPHVTFVNDRFSDIEGKTDIDREKKWDEVKQKWHGKEVVVSINLDVSSNTKSWWLNVDYNHRNEINSIRHELGLGDYFFGLHMTIGNTHPLQEEYATYLVKLHNKGFIKLNNRQII